MNAKRYELAYSRACDRYYRRMDNATETCPAPGQCVTCSTLCQEASNLATRLFAAYRRALAS
jgi:hypothetical protein